MTELPPLSILLGPQTKLALALNAVIRDHRQALKRGGVHALPSRLASPILRRAVNARPAAERAEEFAVALEKPPVFLSAVNALGPPQSAMVQREMFPEAERLLARMADVVTVSRVIICVDVLPAFFLAAGSAPLEVRVRNTPWEALYELSWADLVQEVLDALPQCEVLVLAPSAAGNASLTQAVFGEVEPGLANRQLILRGVISETGHAVLDQIASQDQAVPDLLADLYSSFASRPSVEDVVQQLGIDKVTQALLDQRFEEDLRALSAMERVQVIS